MRATCCAVLLARGRKGQAAYKQNECYSQVPSPLSLFFPACPVWLVCLFACAELNVLLLLNTLFWLPWQIAACCLAMLESVYIHTCVCLCVCVCAGVLTLYKLLIIMSPSECRHDLHESFSLACHFMLSPVKASSRYSIYIFIYICCGCVCVSMAIGKWRCQVTRARYVQDVVVVDAVSALLSPPSLLLALIRLTFSFYT